MKYNPVDIARQFGYVREATANRGLRVEGIQHWAAGQFGDSWCCEFVTWILDICFQGNSPIPRGGVVQTVYNQAKQTGWVTSTPTVGDLFLYVDDNDHAHHIGIVTSLEKNVSTLMGIAGNTSPDGSSSNGTGVYEHDINAHIFVHYPR